MNEMLLGLGAVVFCSGAMLCFFSAGYEAARGKEDLAIMFSTLGSVSLFLLLFILLIFGQQIS